jgi:hypothetical protein
VVAFIALSLDKQRQNLLVEAVFDNPDAALRSNQLFQAAEFDDSPDPPNTAW